MLGAESLSLSPNLLFFFYCCDQFTRLIYLRKSSRVCLGWRKKHSTTYLVGSKICSRGNSTCSRDTPTPMQKKKNISKILYYTLLKFSLLLNGFFYVVSQFVVGCLKSVFLFVSLQYYLLLTHFTSLSCGFGFGLGS